MSRFSALPVDNQILLESGTNEVEVLVFRVGQLTLGINVAKVREVLASQTLSCLPESHSSVVGCFRLRQAVVPCVALARHLSEPSSSKAEDVVIILTEFNQHQIGFVVDIVERIHRISWSQVLATPKIITDSSAPITGISVIDGRMVIMLDFEMIAGQVAGIINSATAVPNLHGLDREQMRIVVADDSPTARHAVEAVLKASGYDNLQIFENGADVWRWLEEQLSSPKPIINFVDLVISDVEMPQVDGFHLTRRIKEHAQLKHLPVLLYSSILTPDNIKKADSVGADAQITKPELHRLVEVVDQLILKSRNNRVPSDGQRGEGLAAPHRPTRSAPADQLSTIA